MSLPSFVAVDWGTTGFRLWVMDAGGKILNATQGPFGMSRLKPDAFGRVLEESLNTLGVDEDVPVVICGMAGAAQGWYEAPYLTAPTQLEILGQQAVVVPNTRRRVRILPGVKQMNPRSQVFCITAPILAGPFACRAPTRNGSVSQIAPSPILKPV
jgi:2-dehydro-3-deoxygalactonokinase